MKILITGNMGYIGPEVTALLRKNYPEATLIGYDMGYFASSLTHTAFLPENQLDQQIFGDVRSLDPAILIGVDKVIYLAAISNDAMGNRYENVTYDINYKAAITIASQAKSAGASSFVFASSCSMYGKADGDAKTELSQLNPLTAYAKSKVYAERDLETLATENFTITCLRFATACGMSSRLRLDLVLNDFVAGAVSSGKIKILSDGSPWRPLIHIKDMARAISWAITRETTTGGEFLAVNAGSSRWNYQVIDLAKAVSLAIPGLQIDLNKNATPDERSYKVNFSLFEKLAPEAQPVCNLDNTIEELYNGLIAMEFDNINFHNSPFMRLKILNGLQEKGFINEDLQWNFKSVATEKNQSILTS
ncbi:SDR family NAD-dependent epimerase/dehydratase [Pedobacter chinensis]|uniref:SDR family NAD-dependent epimerase/dehydratase n=1 Tax=Pedobacter chinensis TaxID=2282421 RepID=A0A369PVZ4_9SPHI|nr:SDR family oxidoreductase [Pedobacter chinensis]RDC54288.1 SDR family NAD-dependent epimerase/dehydratase [Pedobacter chinensis]